MTPLVRLRVAATVLGITAAALRVVSYHLRFEVSTWLASFLSIAVPAGIFLLLLWPLRHLPKSFDLRDGAFTVPPAPSLGGWIIVAGYALGPLITLGDWLSMTVVVALFGLIHLLWRVGLRLTPEGVEVRGIFTRRIPWDAIASGHPGDVHHPKEREVGFFTLDGKRHKIGLGTRYVDPAFLGRAIRDYVEHPEHRAAIGTPAEIDRLASLPRPSSSSASRSPASGL